MNVWYICEIMYKFRANHGWGICLCMCKGIIILGIQIWTSNLFKFCIFYFIFLNANTFYWWYSVRKYKCIMQMYNVYCTYILFSDYF